MDNENPNHQACQAAAANLARLVQARLSAEEISALQRQGVVRSESRGTATLYKLRFRLHGRQVVRYLGTDADHAAQISTALQTLQARRQLKRHQRKRAQELKETLGRIVPRLAAQAALAGWHFHGRTLRRSRPPQST